MKSFILSAILLFTIGSFTMNAQDSSNPKELNTNGDKGVFVSTDELKWFHPFEGAPVQFATVSGSTFKTAHVTFGKFPAGFGPGMHTHSNSYEAMVISGVITNPMASDKGEAKKMGPGSYWYVPANTVHNTKCVSEEPCVFVMFQSVPFDFAPVAK